MSLLDALPTPQALWRWLRQWRKSRLVDAVDRVAVLTSVDENGQLGPRYAFMIVMSGGIAMLGLLQNSAAVIIGAMLIAPLMGPIIEMGMGLATFDSRSVRSALKTLVLGLVLGLLVAMLIVWLSPLKQATPEILARTEPTLFDLLVAVFSGLAGGYATVTRKGETIVGVAIATALMPPLAVLGYGLALGNWHIAGGAWMLLLTNMIAIALSVTVVARLYGFGASDTPQQTALQATLIIISFALLSIPLGLSLQRITVRVQVEAAVRSILNESARQEGGRISGLEMAYGEEAAIVDAVFMTPRHVPGLQEQLAQALDERIGMPLQLNLTEVITADGASIARQSANLAELRNSVQALQSANDTRRQQAEEQRERDAALRDRLLAGFGTLQAVGDGWVYRLRPQARLGLEQAQALEQSVQAGAGDVPVQVAPPLQPLPIITFADDSSQLAAQPAFDTAVWALQRWNVAGVTVEGHGVPAELAQARADAVAQALRARGVAVAGTRAADVGQTRTLREQLDGDAIVRGVRILPLQ